MHLSPGLKELRKGFLMSLQWGPILGGNELNIITGKPYIVGGRQRSNYKQDDTWVGCLITGLFLTYLGKYSAKISNQVVDCAVQTRKCSPSNTKFSEKNMEADFFSAWDLGKFKG